MSARPGPRAAHLWLFPATYLLHAGEEYFCGESFPAWISRAAGAHFTAGAFLWLNGIAWVLMSAAAWLAARREEAHWLRATLGTVVTINGLAHVAGSLATVSYSPGLYTGLGLWLPLGIFTLVHSWSALLALEFVGGVTLGVLAHALVSSFVLLG